MKSKIMCNLKSKYLPFSWCSIVPYIVFFILLMMVLASCSSIDRKDDAVRIKKEFEYKFNQRLDKNDRIVQRDGTTLRGTVLKIIQETRPNSCPVSDTTTYSSKYWILFLDANSGDMSEAEKIPIENVDLIGQKPELKEKLKNRYNNINWFENFNDPLDPRSVREVPVDSFYINNCPDVIDCNCNPLSIALDLNCPDCEYKSYFAEIRGAYAVYDDENANGIPEGREAYYAEFAFGYRTGKWGIGIMTSTGIPVYNSKVGGKDISRPLLMLHGRRQFDKFLCMFPYIYGQFGFAYDIQTCRVLKASICEECSQESDLDLSIPRVSIPLSYGFGVGVDIPLPFCLFDLSFDLGYKSIAVGETFDSVLFNNVSDSKRINMLVLRLGITLGY